MRVCAAKQAPRDPFNLRERRLGLAEIVERGTDVQAERLRVNRPTYAVQQNERPAVPKTWRPELVELLGTAWDPSQEGRCVVS